MLAAAAAAVTGSASTATTFRPARANAMESAPNPQPRSATRITPARASLAARRPATTDRVACSRPDRVKNIRSASGPNFATARWRSLAWVSAPAANSGSYPAVRIAAAAVNASAPARSAAVASAASPSGLRSRARPSKSTPAFCRRRAGSDSASHQTPRR